MPNCFQLIDKETGKAEAFASVDAKMCKHFGVSLHPTRYYEDWYDCEGFSAALGKDFDWMREQDPSRKDIIDWLDEHYTINAWYEPK